MTMGALLVWTERTGAFLVGGAGRPVREALRAVGSFSAVLTAEGATGAGPGLVSASFVAEVAAAERRTGGCALDEARLLIAAEALFPVSPVFSVLLSESAATLFVTGVPNVRDIAPDRASSRVPRVEEVISAPAAPAAPRLPPALAAAFSASLCAFHSSSFLRRSSTAAS